MLFASYICLILLELALLNLILGTIFCIYLIKMYRFFSGLERRATQKLLIRDLLLFIEKQN